MEPIVKMAFLGHLLVGEKSKTGYSRTSFAKAIL